MTRMRFAEEQIIGVLKEGDVGPRQAMSLAGTAVGSDNLQFKAKHGGWMYLRPNGLES